MGPRKTGKFVYPVSLDGRGCIGNTAPMHEFVGSSWSSGRLYAYEFTCRHCLVTCDRKGEIIEFTD